MQLLLRILEYLPGSWVKAISSVRGRFPLLKRVTDWLPSLLRNREVQIQRGVGRGLRFNSGKSAVSFILGTHDVDVQFTLARLLRPGMICYDIGANVGFMAILACRCVEESGQVICFEPLPENAAQMQLNAKLNGFDQIKIHQIALGAKNGEADFRVSRASTWGRLAEAGATPEEMGITRVQVHRLDSFVSSKNLPDPHFIKMDVEGAEAGVLTGARCMLERARPIMVIELHHTYQEVMDALAGLDYTIRPLVSGLDMPNLNDEFQILAYPTGHLGAESLWSAFVTAEKLGFI